MAEKTSHVTAVDKVPGGYGWTCSCGKKSEKPFGQRRRAVSASHWHATTADLFVEFQS